MNDEVQSGCGRTGPVWAIEHYGVEPDLLVSGKTLGGGLPLAAVTGRAEVIDAVPPGGLGGTFGGNPVSCAAALAILDALEAQRPHAEQIGARLRERLEAMAPAGSEVRGLGPMLAIELPERTGDEAVAHHRRSARAGPAAALLRHLRERDPHPRAVHDRRRGARAGARHPRGASPLMAADVGVEGIRKTYGDVVAVDDVDLQVGEGEFFTLLGPSGSGKTTTLRDDRRLRAARRGPRHARRRGHHPTSRPTRATSTPSSRTTRSSRT